MQLPNELADDIFVIPQLKLDGERRPTGAPPVRLWVIKDSKRGTDQLLVIVNRGSTYQVERGDVYHDLRAIAFKDPVRWSNLVVQLELVLESRAAASFNSYAEHLVLARCPLELLHAAVGQTQGALCIRLGSSRKLFQHADNGTITIFASVEHRSAEMLLPERLEFHSLRCVLVAETVTSTTRMIAAILVGAGWSAEMSCASRSRDGLFLYLIR